MKPFAADASREARGANVSGRHLGQEQVMETR